MLDTKTRACNLKKQRSMFATQKSEFCYLVLGNLKHFSLRYKRRNKKQNKGGQILSTLLEKISFLAT